MQKTSEKINISFLVINSQEEGKNLILVETEEVNNDNCYIEQQCQEFFDVSETILFEEHPVGVSALTPGLYNGKFYVKTYSSMTTCGEEYDSEGIICDIKEVINAQPLKEYISILRYSNSDHSDNKYIIAIVYVDSGKIIYIDSNKKISDSDIENLPNMSYSNLERGIYIAQIAFQLISSEESRFSKSNNFLEEDNAIATIANAKLVKKIDTLPHHHRIVFDSKFKKLEVKIAINSETGVCLFMSTGKDHLYLRRKPRCEMSEEEKLLLCDLENQLSFLHTNIEENKTFPLSVILKNYLVDIDKKSIKSGIYSIKYRGVLPDIEYSYHEEKESIDHYFSELEPIFTPKEYYSKNNKQRKEKIIIAVSSDSRWIHIFEQLTDRQIVDCLLNESLSLLELPIEEGVYEASYKCINSWEERKKTYSISDFKLITIAIAAKS